MLYSASEKGFFDETIHGDAVPSDCVEVPQEEYQNLMLGQSSGKQIVPNSNGYPVLQDYASPTAEEQQKINSAAARKYLNETDWYVIRSIEKGIPVPDDVSEKREVARLSVVG